MIKNKHKKKVLHKKSIKRIGKVVYKSKSSTFKVKVPPLNPALPVYFKLRCDLTV